MSGVRRVWLVSILIGSLAACHASDGGTKLSHQDKKAEAAIDNAVAVNGTAAALNGLPVPQAAAVQAVLGIPSAFIGRWGITSGDCLPAVSDAKGALKIASDSLRFYESKGSLEAITRHTADDVTVKLDMSGEGQHWTSVTHLVLSAGGTRLERSEASSPTHYRYQRC